MARTVFRRPPRGAAFDVVVSGSVALFASFGMFSWTDGWTSPLIGVGMSVALLFRRRHSVAVAVAVDALALLQVILGGHPAAHDVAVLIAMYSVVKYADRLRDGIIGGAGVAAGALLAAITMQGPWWITLIFLLLVGAAVWLIGLTVRTRRLYVISLEERAATLERERDAEARAAVAEERTRIARELHDIVAHSLLVMIVQADGARYMFDHDAPAARRAVRAVSDTGRQALEEMRRLVGVLRDPAPPGASGPDERPEQADPAARALDADPVLRPVHLGELDGLLDRSRAAGLTVRYAVRGEPVGLASGLDLTVYRLVQEALTNVLKHAGAGAAVQVILDYAVPGVLGVRVLDDGRGHPVGGPAPSGGHGLVGMRERVAVYDGTFHAAPRLAGGWEVAVRLPLPSPCPATEPAPKGAR